MGSRTPFRASAKAVLTLAFTAVASVGAWQACRFYDESMLEPALSAPEGGNGDVDGGPVDPCTHAAPPPRPPSPGSGTELPSIVLAARRLRVMADAGTPLGLDMDGVCSCQFEQPGSCVGPDGAAPVCDDEQGRDNALGGILQRLGAVSPAFRSLEGSKDLEEGQRGTLLELRGYNGEADDDGVVVAIYASNGIGYVDGGAPDAADGGTGVRKKPVWNGDDRWGIDSRSLLGDRFVGAEPVARYYDDRAYVRDHILVAQPVRPDQTVEAALGSLNFDITGGTVVGRLAKDANQRWTFEGQLLARITLPSLLGSLAVLDDPTAPGKKLCGDSDLYQLLKRELCKAPDLYHLPTSGVTTLPCDAISSALGVYAEQARFGGVEDIPAPSIGCGPGYTDDCDR